MILQKTPSHELLGTNRFSPYRKKQGDFLEKLTLNNPIKFAVSHICPMMTTDKKGGNHDIEREEFFKCKELIEEGKSIIIHGKAGYGKSGISCSIG